jgi:tRNA threonylcarbamoyladenosine biosynthesis protein TsaE
MTEEMVCRSVESLSTEATENIGRALAAIFTAGDICVLDGDLGAGKTALTRGIANGLGLTSQVTSPTYTIVTEHLSENAGLELFHFDVYRIHGPEDFVAAGLDEYFDRGGICVIEWGRKIESILPEDRICIEIYGTGSTRKVQFCFPKKYEDRLNDIMNVLSGDTGITI